MSLIEYQFASIFVPTKTMTVMKSNTITKEAQSKVKKKVYRFLAGVEFGVPSKNCKNFGLCRLDPIDKMITIKDSQHYIPYAALALISIQEGNNQGVDFFFLKQGMSPENEKKHFGNNFFAVEEPFTFFSKSPCDPASKSKKIVINPGIYPSYERPWGIGFDSKKINSEYQMNIDSLKTNEDNLLK